ncbi:hypothetical protein K431DRAFT_302773 [Polychaeton citri CBS 116435]|uniref:Uncharacterized protein n=1 Tax=Polychaeton citri CBS 116435 TaxID=1314669 RepID=A0A9P4Q9N6_9PEZI|nr:hypothetical protein K431DRAFT_302773 [Polychaeton citri CBS 116435]
MILTEQNRSKAAAVALLEALIAGSDGESTLLLARLRLGDQIEDIAGIRMLSQFGNVPLPDSDIADQQPQARRCSFGPSPVPGLEEAFARELWMDDKSAQSASEHTMASWSRHCMPNNVMSIAPLHDCHFDNASLPCTAGLTGQPTSRQDRHKGDFHLPVWAIQTMNCLRSLTVADPFETVITELKKKIGEGADGEDLCGPHAYIAALYDEATFMRAPQLSKMVVSIVNSIRSEDSSPAAVVTTYATMWLYWALFRWMLIPSSQTYCDVPVLFRPTPWQVFAPHMRIYDFIIWPSLREHICQQPSDADMRWFTEACMAVKCDWPWGVSRALCLDPSTNEVDLSIFCKTHIESAGNWPLGPSIDQYMRNQVPMGFNDTSV